MSAKTEEAAMTEVIATINHSLLNLALAGCAIRKLRDQGHNEQAIEAVGGNELKAHLLRQIADRLEQLIRTGHGLDDALTALRHEGWLTKAHTH